jgi:hypothetical protein
VRRAGVRGHRDRNEARIDGMPVKWREALAIYVVALPPLAVAVEATPS